MEATEQIPLEADAVHIARVAELGGSSMRMAEADPFDGSLMDPLEDTLDDLDSSGDSLDETATDAVFSALGDF